MKRREEIEQAAMQVGGVHPDWDALECFRVGYKEGAKWADKTMIEKACEWLEEKNKMYMYELEMILGKQFINDFKKTMEE